MIASRAFRFACLLAAGLFGSDVVAGTPALVVDVDSGKVLFADRATDPWYPASITKLMTTYVALDMVRQGRASMDQLLTISPLAAAEPPSKMGFKPGTQLTLDNALKIIMVKSANDIAWAIAEGLGGSVEGFAGMMNEASQRLGMRESVWVNPNGLPDDRQHTSARDMAVLGRALLRDFPDRKDLFSISAIQFGRRVMANHNGLLGRYPGVDGMKTGFICSGGFNVVASATRDGRRLITVVMGSRTARERTLYSADLFDRGFSLSSWGGQSLDELPASSTVEPRNMRPVVCERHKPEPEEDAEVAAGSAGAAPGMGTATGLFAAAPSSALAFAGMSSASWQGRTLPPRAPLQPILVWIGRDPAESRITAADGDTENSPTPVKGRRKGASKATASLPARKVPLRARVDAAIAAAQANAVPTPSIMSDGSHTAAVNPLAVAAAPVKAAATKHGAIGATPARSQQNSSPASLKTAGAKPGAIAPRPSLAALKASETPTVKPKLVSTKPAGVAATKAAPVASTAKKPSPAVAKTTDKAAAAKKPEAGTKTVAAKSTKTKQEE